MRNVFQSCHSRNAAEDRYLLFADQIGQRCPGDAANFFAMMALKKQLFYFPKNNTLGYGLRRQMCHQTALSKSLSRWRERGATAQFGILFPAHALPRVCGAYLAQAERNEISIRAGSIMQLFIALRNFVGSSRITN